MSCKKQGTKNMVIVIQKEKRQPVFCTLLCNTSFGPIFFQGHKPTHVFKTRIVDED